MKPPTPNNKVRMMQLARAILESHEVPGDCDGCDRHLSRLAEYVAGGRPLCDVLPTVQAHLDSCADCNEEFQALLAIVRAEAQGLC
jgi:hypothetical protein